MLVGKLWPRFGELTAYLLIREIREHWQLHHRQRSWPKHEKFLCFGVLLQAKRHFEHTHGVPSSERDLCQKVMCFHTGHFLGQTIGPLRALSYFWIKKKNNNEWSQRSSFTHSWVSLSAYSDYQTTDEAIKRPLQAKLYPLMKGKIGTFPYGPQGLGYEGIFTEGTNLH